jgi:hypothetical protein
MRRFTKKPIEIEAFQFYVDAMPDWFMDRVSANDIVLFNCNLKECSINEAYCEIQTLEGVMRANGGDWIIKGVKGELYPCKPDIFKMTYEEV